MIGDGKRRNTGRPPCRASGRSNRCLSCEHWCQVQTHRLPGIDFCSCTAALQVGAAFPQQCQLQPSLFCQLPLGQPSDNSTQPASGGMVADAAAPMDMDATNNIDAEAAAAATAVDRAKVASMLDALALQQPLFMSSKYVKIADLNRWGALAASCS